MQAKVHRGIAKDFPFIEYVNGNVGKIYKNNRIDIITKNFV